MTFNVRYFAHQHAVSGLSSTRRGVQSVCRALAALDDLPHVIGLQEVEHRSLRAYASHGRGQTSQMDVLTDRLQFELDQREASHRYRSLYFPAHAYQMGRLRIYTTGLAIFVRDDLQVDTYDTREITFRRPQAMAARLKQSRICAHVRVSVGGRRVDVFNTHLSLPLFWSPRWFKGHGRLGGGRNQVQEADRLASFIQARSYGGRFVVMGDFNSQPDSDTYRRLSEGYGWVDGVRSLGAPLDPTAGFLNLRMRLDHVFHGPGLRQVDQDDTHAYGDRTGRWHGLSDHVPVLGRLEPN
jgi:endonuclease/exonuclease/phosphatase family metal-dependent hydrolase